MLQREIERAGDRVDDSNRQLQTIMVNLAYALADLGRAEEALPLYERVADVRARTLGDDHPLTLTAMNNAASCLWLLGRQVESVDRATAVYEASRRVRGEDHPDTNLIRGNLAFMNQALGRLDEAERLNREALDAVRRAGMLESVQGAITRENLAMLLHERGAHREAIELQRAGIATLTELVGADAETTLNARFNLGRGLLASESREAPAFWAELESDCDRALGIGHSLSIQAPLFHARALAMAGEPHEQAALDAAARIAETIGAEHPLHDQAMELVERARRGE
jgi:tetratricopeptide (TPR) repeat protein